MPIVLVIVTCDEFVDQWRIPAVANTIGRSSEGLSIYVEVGLRTTLRRGILFWRKYLHTLVHYPYGNTVSHGCLFSFGC